MLIGGLDFLATTGDLSTSPVELLLPSSGTTAGATVVDNFPTAGTSFLFKTITVRSLEMLTIKI